MSEFYALENSEQLRRLEALVQQALVEFDRVGARVELIKARENAVFKITSVTGEKTALRVHRAGYHTNAALRSELKWMNALNDHGVSVPEVIPTRDHELFCVLGGDEVGGARQIDLFRWVDGEELGAIDETDTLDLSRLTRSFETVGQIAGRIHSHSTVWTPPADFSRHGWDIDGLVGESPLWGRFWELDALNSEQRRLMGKVRHTLQKALSALPDDSHHFGMIHADLVPENVLVDGDSVRLIDFDDAGFGWYLFEMATSLYFFYLEDFFGDLKQAYVTGYRQQRVLPDEELAKLPLLLLARSTTYLGWVHTRPNTQTAQEMTPALIEMACAVANDYYLNSVE